MIRTSGTFADISSQCDEADRNGGGPLPPTSGSYIACKRLLSRVPTTLEHIDKKLSSTLQFINVAINPSNSCEVMGGTQDNGTWSNNERLRQADTFNQVIYGDGGNAGYDATNPTWRFNEFTGGFSDSNFRNGDPEKWVITLGADRQQRRGPGVLLAADRRSEPGARHAPDLLRGAARLADAGPSAPARPGTSRRTRPRTSPATRRTARSS